MTRPKMVCQGCGKGPLELEEYRELCKSESIPNPSDEVILKTAWEEEGTLNTENGHFLCSICYIKAGMPSSPTGWKCP